MKRVLVVSPVATHPINQGSAARVYSLAEAIRRLGCEVHFLYIADTGAPATLEHPELTGYWGDRLHTVTLPTHSLPRFASRPLTRVRLALSWRWYQWVRGGRLPVDIWYRPEVGQTAVELHARHRFTTVVVEYVSHSRLLTRFGDDVHKVLDTIDAWSVRTDQLIRSGRRDAIYCPISRRQERKGVARADTVLAIQEAELAYFRGLTRKRVLLVGHLLPAVTTAPRPPAPGVLFVGGNSQLNAAAVAWLLDRVWPVVRGAIPDATLTVAGRVGTACPHPLPQGVSTSGDVPDLGPVYRSHAVVVNPVPAGSGLAIKSIEALGAGRPLVATTAGGRGLSAAVGRGLTIADDPTRFAAEVIRLLRDRAAWTEAADAAAAFAAEWNQTQLAALREALRLGHQ